MASANPDDSPDHGVRPDSHPHTQFNHLDSEENLNSAAASPPYRQNVSQLTLPPGYLSAGPSQVDLHQRGEMSDEKRRIDVPRDSDETDNFGDNARADADSPRPQSRPVIEGDTLVGTRTDRPHVVRYPDELGVKLPRRQSNHPYAVEHLEEPEQSRTFSGGKQSTLYTEDEASDNDEKYDWSDEDDLVDEQAKFEEKLGVKTAKKKTWGFKRIGTFFVSTLVGSAILAGIIAAIPTIIHFFWYKPHPTSHRRWVSDNISAWFYWAAANLLISWYLAAMLNLLPLVTTWIVRTTWGTVTERFKGNVAMYDGFKGWIKPILYAASAWLSWSIIFSGIYGFHTPNGARDSRAGYTDRVQQIIQLLFFVVLMFCLEKIVLQIITFTFHRVAFEGRIREVNKATKVLDHLKEYKPERKAGGGHRTPGIHFGLITQSTLLPRSWPLNRTRSHGHIDAQVLEDGFAADNDEVAVNATTYNKKRRSRKGWFAGKRGPGSIGTSAEMTPISPTQPEWSRGSHPDTPSPPPGSSAQAHTYPPNHRSEADTDDEGIGGVASTAAKAFKTAMLHDARNIKGKDHTAADLGFAISSPHEAKKLARNLYSALRGDSRRRYLVPSDFYPAYRTHAEAKEAFKIFDSDGNENITRAEIKTTIMMIYKERRFLARSLRDVDHALSSLDLILMTFFTIVLFFISLSVFNVSIGKSLASIYTLGLAGSFVFKNAASNAFDAVMFLFVTHPFDTGDRCFINGENLIVKRMGLFATTFIRADGTQLYYFNSQLFADFISNIRRSDKMFENLTMQINWRTPLEKLDELEKHINHWMEADENRWFGGSTNCILQYIENQRSLQVTISIPHNSNWQDWGAYLNRKTVFHAAVNHYCRQLGITWIHSTQPVLVVNPDDKAIPHPSAYETGPTVNELELPHVDSKEEVPSSPMAPLSAPKPALLFQPPLEEYVAGMRHRKTKNNAARGNHGA